MPKNSNAEQSLYECDQCQTRLTAAEAPGSCPTCGGPMQNISVPRE